MTSSFNYQFGSIYPQDSNRGLVYGNEPIQKILNVTLDAYFTDPNKSAPFLVSRIISVGTSGNVTLVWKDGSSTTVPMVQGIWYPVQAIQILSTDTTATGIQWGY